MFTYFVLQKQFYPCAFIVCTLNQILCLTHKQF